MHFMLVWKEAERTKRPAPPKETFYLCYFEFIFTPEQFCKFFLFANGIFTSKAAKLICHAYFRNKESLANAVPNPLVQNQDLWTLVASYEISRKYRKMASDCFLLYIVIPALK